jgi:hypothetical protein
MFDRTQLTTEQMTTLNRAYVLLRVHGKKVWQQRYKALTVLPQELKDEIEAERE